MQPDVEVVSHDRAASGTPFWGYSDLFLVLGLLFAATVAVVISTWMLQRFSSVAGTDYRVQMIVQLIFYAAVYGAFKLVFAIRYEKPVLASLGWVKSEFPLKWALLGGGLLTIGVQSILIGLKTPPVHSQVDEMLKAHPVLIGTLAVTLAPFFEELFFRGFLQPLFIRSLGVFAGIFVPALCFGLLHLFQYGKKWQVAVAITTIGIVLGIVRRKANSIKPSTLMHCTYNGALIAASIIGNNQHK